MARLAVALMVALFASVALGQSAAPGCNVVASNVFNRPTNCVEYQNCERAVCACSGVSDATPQCLGNISTSTVACNTLTNCFGAFVRCLSTVANTVRTNTTNPCNMWAVTLHTSVLAIAATAFGNSTLEAMCAARACELRNITGRTTCDMGGVNFTSVCNFANVVGPSTSAPTPLPGSASAVSMAAAAVLAVIAALM